MKKRYHIKTWEELKDETKLVYLDSAKRRIENGFYDYHFLSIFNTDEELAKYIYNKSVEEWYTPLTN